MIDATKLKLNGFPKIVRRLNLVDFAQVLRDAGIAEESAAAVEELLRDDHLDVWLNHNGEFLDAWLEYNDAVQQGMKLVERLKTDKEAAAELVLHTEQTEQRAFEVFALLWGCSVEEARAIKDVSAELYHWCGERAWAMVREYQDQRKKGAGR